jgi:endonuclease/exonuclease/phosphatase family metal-dependent hydrolase
MKMIALLILLISTISCNANKEEVPEKELIHVTDTFKVMTFNMWHGGDAGGQPIAKSIETIRAADAGIVGVQESHGLGSPREDRSMQMAGNMGWRHIDIGNFDAVLTKYAIAETSSDKRAVKIKIDDNKFIWIINCHLMHIPYQPYQLNNKEYGNYPYIASEQEAVHWANIARKSGIDEVVKLVKEKINDGWPIIVTGDFNEPSHLDWTEKAAKAGINKIKVEWPSTKALTDLGMKDAYRTFRPDEVAFPGKTWSSIDSPGEIHDRIDFVFYIGNQLQLINAEVVGEKSNISDIAVENYPSDHRAVVATFVWKGKN